MRLPRSILAVGLLSLLSLPCAPVFAQGSSIMLTDLRQRTHTVPHPEGKWVLINFWATWCAPCVTEMPELEALSRARSDLLVVGVAVDGKDARRIAQFAERLGVSYPIVAGNPELARQFRARGYPTSILYNGAGEQVLFREGPVTQRELEAMLPGGRNQH